MINTQIKEHPEKSKTPVLAPLGVIDLGTLSRAQALQTIFEFLKKSNPGQRYDNLKMDTQYLWEFCKGGRDSIGNSELPLIQLFLKGKISCIMDSS